MKILITGGLGHIGSYVIEKLVKNKNIKEIFLADNISNQRFNVLFKLKNKKNSIYLWRFKNKKFFK